MLKLAPLRHCRPAFFARTPIAATLTEPQIPERLYDRSMVLAVISQLSFVIANTLLTHYARWVEHLDGGLPEIGWIMGVGAGAGIVCRPWIAQWINHWGAKKLWFGGFLLFSVASLTNLAIYELGPAIFVARSLVMVAAAIVFAASITYVSQIAPASRSTEAIGMLGIGGFVGMMAGPYLGDYFLSGVVRERSQFVALFVVAAAASLLPGILLLAMRSPDLPEQRRGLNITQFVQSVREFWPGPILAVDLVFGLCMTIPFVFLAKFFDDVSLELPWQLSPIGVFFFVYAGFAITIRLALRKLPDQIGSTRVLLGGMLLMATGMFAFCWLGKGSSYFLLVPALLTGAGHGLMFHTMTALTLQPFPLALRGTGSALTLMMLDLGTFLGSPTLGTIGDTFGYPSLFFFTGAATLATTFYFAAAND